MSIISSPISFAPLDAAPLDAAPAPEKKISWADMTRPSDEESVDLSSFTEAFGEIFDIGKKIQETKAKVIPRKPLQKQDIRDLIFQTKAILEKINDAKGFMPRFETCMKSNQQNIHEELFTKKCAGCRHETCTHSHTDLKTEEDCIKKIQEIISLAKEFQENPHFQTFYSVHEFIFKTEKSIQGLRKDLQTAESQLKPCVHWLNGNCSHEACSFGHEESKKGSQKKVQETCRHWKSHGTCTYKGCKFAHPEVDKPIKTAARTKTCKHWQKGNCKLSSEVCQFAHFNIE